MVLIEVSDRILSTFSPDLSEKAVKQQEECSVPVRTGTRVAGIDARGMHLEAMSVCPLLWWAWLVINAVKMYKEIAWRD
jgi:NADH dehydrogenase FAD-containing subunit